MYFVGQIGFELSNYQIAFGADVVVGFLPIHRFLSHNDETNGDRDSYGYALMVENLSYWRCVFFFSSIDPLISLAS